MALHSTPEPTKQRPTWVMPVLIIGLVVVGVAAVAGLFAVVGFLLLRSGADYLNGAPITISDQAIEQRVAEDTKWIISQDFASFDSKVKLSEKDAAYHDDIKYLQRGGQCGLATDTIKKRQGGFDNGASINYDGTVRCAGGTSYHMAVRYGASAQTKKEAADMNRFELERISITSDDQTLIETVSKINGQFVSRDMKGKPITALPNDTRTFTDYSEYSKSLAGGELKGCREVEAPRYSLDFDLNMRVSSNVNRLTGTAVINCG